MITVALTDTESRLREVLDLLSGLDQKTAYASTEDIVDVLRSWVTEYGESRELLEAVCQKLSVDRATIEVYLRCPQLIPLMEPLRKGEPIKKLKITMSEEGRRWWYALLVMEVLRKCDGLISHVRLLRWLSHRLDAGRIRTTLELLREARLVETYQVKGNDPLRPVTWHRLIANPGDLTKCEAV